MTKVDFKKQLKHLYIASAKEPVIIDVPAMNFLMIDGIGDPNTSKEYMESVEALFSASYTLKFKIKKEQKVDYGVLPLEGLWWADDVADFAKGNKDKWKWTSMIMQPEYVTEELVKEAVEKVKKKKELPGLVKMRFEQFTEGKAAQIMHIGSYAKEGPTIEKLHSFVKALGLTLRDKHHEIYLGDPRRSAPEKLKTVIRHPVK